MPRADLALYDRDGQLTAVVEIKNKIGTSPEWAAKLRRNILAHGGFRSADFFLLITPDRLYVWQGAGETPVAVEPTFQIDARPLLQPYFDRAGLDSTAVSGQAFELLVAAWLSDLMRLRSPEPREQESWLADSGFLGAVRDGRVEYEVAA
jgi:hypothetical protein